MLRIIAPIFLAVASTAVAPAAAVAQTRASADSCQDLETRMSILQALRESEPASLVSGVKKILARRFHESTP